MFDAFERAGLLREAMLDDEAVRGHLVSVPVDAFGVVDARATWFELEAPEGGVERGAELVVDAVEYKVIEVDESGEGVLRLRLELSS